MVSHHARQRVAMAILAESKRDGIGLRAVGQIKKSPAAFRVGRAGRGSESLTQDQRVWEVAPSTAPQKSNSYEPVTPAVAHSAGAWAGMTPDPFGVSRAVVRIAIENAGLRAILHPPAWWIGEKHPYACAVLLTPGSRGTTPIPALQPSPGPDPNDSPRCELAGQPSTFLSAQR
jgi:hypothetical protein